MSKLFSIKGITHFVISGILCLISGAFQGNLLAQKYTIRVVSDTVISTGVNHIAWESAEPRWSGDIVVAHWSPLLQLKTVKANNELKGYQTTQYMMRSYEQMIQKGKKVVAGINGDFYKAGGVPVHSQLIDGEILKLPVQRDAIAMDEEQRFYLGSFSYSGQLEILDPTTVLAIDGVNMAREADQLIVYNQYYGDSTQTNAFGYEVVLEQLDFRPINRPELFRVVELEDYEKGFIPDGHVVLSAHGVKVPYLQALTQGDSVRITHGLLQDQRPISEQPALVEFIGGSKVFLHDGQVDGNWPERHPRSALGFNSDTTKVYLFTVDGRQESSVGMSLTEMAEVMKYFGAVYAINLDGGGSTTLVANDKVLSSPSDPTGQRRVSNAVILVQDQ